MPPTVALFFCIVFVVVLLWLDRRQSPGVSHALWIPTIWLLYCGSRPLVEWFSPGAVGVTQLDVENGSPLDRNFLAVLMVMALFVIIRRRIDWSQMFHDHRWIVLLLIFMGFSLLWSDYPWVSLKRWIRASGSIVMGLAILAERSPQEALECVIRRSAYLLIPFSVLLIKYYPDLGIVYHPDFGDAMWQGVTPQKNNLGQICMGSALYLMWSLMGPSAADARNVSKWLKRANLTVLVMCLWLLKGSGASASNAYSATSIVGLLLGIWVLISLIWLPERWRYVFFTLSLAAVGIMIVNVLSTFFLGDSLLSFFIKSLGRGTNFTGRTEIWNQLWSTAVQHPILGCGYGGFWIDPKICYGVNEGHNGFLDVFLTLGIMGVVLALMDLKSFYLRAKRAMEYDSRRASLAIAFLLVFVMDNLTETSLLRATNYLWTLLLFFAFGFLSSQALLKPAHLASDECEAPDSLDAIITPYPNDGQVCATEAARLGENPGKQSTSESEPGVAPISSRVL